MKGTDIYIGPVELERKRAAIKRRLLMIWSIYALIVGGLAYFALWVGDWKWNAEVMVFAWPLFVIAPALAIFRLFLQMNRLIKAGMDKWRDILRFGVPMGRFTDIEFPDTNSITNNPAFSNWEGNIFYREN